MRSGEVIALTEGSCCGILEWACVSVGLYKRKSYLPCCSESSSPLNTVFVTWLP